MHLQSKCHIKAIEAVAMLPRTTKDVGMQLSSAHSAEKEQARDMLKMIYPVWASLPGKNWLALRGDGSDASCTLIPASSYES